MDYKISFEKILNEYRHKNKPVFVNFRELVDTVKFTERGMHSIHPYTAKLICNIPYFFLNNSYFVCEKQKVLDPFCGSGTVLLESKIAKLKPFGSDANPLARLITNVKCNIYDINKLIFHKENLFILLKEIKSKTNIENRKNIDFWFEKNIQIQLSNIYKCVMSIEEQKYKEFYLVCFSNCVKKVSFADSRISVPVKLNPERYPESSQERLKYQNKIDELKTIDVVNKFFDIVNQNIKRVVKQKMFNDNMKANIVSNDSRNLSNLKDETIDLVLTSPPYAGAQKCIRASSLNLYWLGYNNLKVLDNENIGRENYRKDEYKNLLVTGINDADILLQKIYKINPLRAHIASNYLVEMKNAFIESIRVLKKNKFLILVSSNNMVCGYEFKTQKFFKKNIGPSIFCIYLSLNQKKNNESLNYYSFNYYFQRNYYAGRRNAIEYLKNIEKAFREIRRLFL